MLLKFHAAGQTARYDRTHCMMQQNKQRDARVLFHPPFHIKRMQDTLDAFTVFI